MAASMHQLHRLEPDKLARNEKGDPFLFLTPQRIPLLPSSNVRHGVPASNTSLYPIKSGALQQQMIA